MPTANPHFHNLRREYIFPIIEKKLEDLKARHNAADVINLGVGDIALPIAPAILKAIKKGVDEMGKKDTFRGYGPTEGYDFLRTAIAKHEFSDYGIGPEEIFISDGANPDSANMLELFDLDNTIGIPDPTYPVYLDTAIMSGREKKISILPCTLETGFVPLPPSTRCDVVYLCTPNNPTGVALNRKQLQLWVDWAKIHNAILLVDNAYAAFISSLDVPKSIYEIPGAKEVAVEFRSFSKTAGFTGLRCSYTIVPKTVYATLGKEKVSLRDAWNRRQAVKTNGVAYPIQRGAEAVFSPLGQTQTRSQIASYLKQAKTFLEGLTGLGYSCWGGKDAPYIWWKTPNNLKSWDFIDLLLEKCHLIAIPGVGFGFAGEGYVRLSTFTTPAKAKKALHRIKQL